MSIFNLSASGICLYRKTLYPASISIESRSLSCFSRPSWLLSSSSMMARTVNALSVTTKSAIFCAKLYRLAPSRADSKAPKLTCAKTIYPSDFNVFSSRQNIFCSLAVAICFLMNLPFLSFSFGLLALIAATSITRMVINPININVFNLGAPFCADCDSRIQVVA